MICNPSLAFRKSGALPPMPLLKAAPWKNTVRASKPLSLEIRENQPKNIFNELLKMKF